MFSRTEAGIRSLVSRLARTSPLLDSGFEKRPTYQIHTQLAHTTHSNNHLTHLTHFET